LFTLVYDSGNESGTGTLYLNSNKNTQVQVALWGAQMVVSSSAGDNITNVIPAALNVTPPEAGGKLWYSWDDGQTYTNTYVAPTNDGTYNVLVRQQDAAGNNSASKNLKRRSAPSAPPRRPTTLPHSAQPPTRPQASPASLLTTWRPSTAP
jgi:hypothetical protein